MGESSTEEAGPRSVVVELARTDDGGDPFAFRFSDQDYLVRGAGGTYREITIPWRGELWTDLQEMRASPEQCQRLGDRLRRLLEAAEWDRIEALARTASAEQPLILTIRSAAAELFALPWGLVTMEGDGRHLAELRHVLLRHEWSGAKAPPPVSDTPQRVLVAWSSAGGAVPHNEQIAAIRRSCAHRELPFDLHRDVITNVTPKTLAEALSDPRRPVTALHILCHGEATETGTCLLFDADDGGEVRVDGGTLRRLIIPHTATLRLVVLSACASGAAAQRSSHLGSVAQALHRAGVEAVVASRTALSVDGSVELTRQLYRGLLVSARSLEASMMRARARLIDLAGHLDWAALQLYGKADAGGDTRPFALRPYRGLLPFNEQDKPFFFGRGREIAALSEWAMAAVAGERGLHVILGTTGSGKLSLLRAGLIPALSRRKDRRWRAAVIRPGDDADSPRSALSVAFKQVMGDALALAEGTHTTDTLLQALRSATSPDDALLLVVNRFEEVFTHLQDRRQATAYVRALVELAACPGVAVVVTMRTDYIERCAELKLSDGRRLDELLYSDRTRTLLGAPGADDLRELIVGPARSVGLKLEPELVERLVADIEGEVAALPLLQHTLDLLWTKREGRRLTLAAYEGIGRIAGALIRSADAVIAAMSPPERAQARCLLVALVDLGVDLVPKGRRRIDREVLRPLLAEARASFDEVVDRLVAGRLIICGVSIAGQTVPRAARRAKSSIVWLDLAHEALIERWPLLQGWIEEDRGALVELRRVVSAYQEWRAHVDTGAARYDYLLVGERLADALRLSRRRPGLVPVPVLLYIRESAELVAASHMRGLIDRLIPAYAVPLSLAFLPGLSLLQTDAPGAGLALIAGATVFVALLRAWSWGVMVSHRVVSWATVDILIHAWNLAPLTVLAAWGALGSAPDPAFAGLSWSAWISISLAAVAFGRALELARLIRQDPEARRWGGALLGVGLVCVALNLGALLSSSAWPLWLLALATDILATWLLRSRLSLSGRDDGHEIASKIDDAVVVVAGLVALLGVIGGTTRGPDLIGLAALIVLTLVAFSLLAVTSRRAAESTSPDALTGPKWLFARALILAGLSLLGIAGNALLTLHAAPLGRSIWALATLVFSLGVLLGPGTRTGARGRRLAIVAISVAVLSPALTLALMGQSAWIWSASLAALSLAGIISLHRGPLSRSAERRIRHAEERARRDTAAPDSATLVETLSHTRSTALLREDPSNRAIAAARRW